MAFLRNIRSKSYLFSTFHKLRTPITHYQSESLSSDQILRLPIIHRSSVSFSTLFSTKIDTDSENIDVSAKKPKQKPLDIFFKEAVGILEAPRNYEDVEENDNLRSNLRKLGEEVRVLQEKREIEMGEKFKRRVERKKDNEDTEKESKASSLSKLFKKRPSQRSEAPIKNDLMLGKRLSPVMVMLVTHLYEEGYFKDANFLPLNKFDITCFDDSYALHYIKHAVAEFAKDKQEAAKWLSAEDLKKVALFGCPCLVRRHIYSAKMLRKFFKIQEDTVCGKCALRGSCKFANKNMWSSKTKVPHLSHVMRILVLYALESVPKELILTEEIKESVNRLLEEAVKLSKVC